jgi:hypothetical protein
MAGINVSRFRDLHLEGIEAGLITEVEKIFEDRCAGIGLRVFKGVVRLKAHPRFCAPEKARTVSARRWDGEREAVRSRRSLLSERSASPSTAEMAAKLLLPSAYPFGECVLPGPLIVLFCQNVQPL